MMWQQEGGDPQFPWDAHPEQFVSKVGRGGDFRPALRAARGTP